METPIIRACHDSAPPAKRARADHDSAADHAPASTRPSGDIAAAGTVARNLGPEFDAAAPALDLFERFDSEPVGCGTFVETLNSWKEIVEDLKETDPRVTDFLNRLGVLIKAGEKMEALELSSKMEEQVEEFVDTTDQVAATADEYFSTVVDAADAITHKKLVAVFAEIRQAAQAVDRAWLKIC